MKIVTTKAPTTKLASLKPGDVFTWDDSNYWIVSDMKDGNKIHILQLNTGILSIEPSNSIVTPVPNAYLHI